MSKDKIEELNERTGLKCCPVCETYPRELDQYKSELLEIEDDNKDFESGYNTCVEAWKIDRLQLITEIEGKKKPDEIFSKKKDGNTYVYHDAEAYGYNNALDDVISLIKEHE